MPSPSFFSTGGVLRLLVSLLSSAFLLATTSAQSSSSSSYYYYSVLDTLTASNAAQVGSAFGYAVTMHGTTIVVGDESADPGLAGAAYVYEATKKDDVDSMVFQETAVLTSGSDGTGTPMSYFGSSVAMDEDIIVVGTFAENAAYVYVKQQQQQQQQQQQDANNGNTNWVLQQKLTVANAAGRFGASVAVSGDRIAVGDYVQGTTGVVTVFERDDSSGASVWTETQTLTPSDGATASSNTMMRFGQGLDMEGDTIVVGAPRKNDENGGFYIFTLQNNDSWEETRIVEAPNGGRFGEKIALSMDRIAVTAPQASQAYVYGLEDASLGPIVLTGTPDADSDADGFASSIDIYNQTIVVGAPFKAGDSGAIYVFTPTTSEQKESWSQTALITTGTTEDTDELGFAVAVTNDHVVGGAPGSSRAGRGLGAAFVFVEQPVAPSAQPSQAPTPSPTKMPSSPQEPTGDTSRGGLDTEAPASPPSQASFQNHLLGQLLVMTIISVLLLPTIL